MSQRKNVFKKIERKIKKQSGAIITDLYPLLSNKDQIQRAIKESNNSTPGPDGVRKKDIVSDSVKLDQFIERIQERLRNADLRPAKPRIRNVQNRDIAIYNYEDRVISILFFIVLNSIFGHRFEKESIAYQKHKSSDIARKLLLRLSNEIAEGWLIQIDIKCCFPSIRTEALLPILEQNINDTSFLNSLKIIIDHPYKNDGLELGSALSCILCNIFLDYIVDKALKAYQKTLVNARLEFVRYADDLLIVTNDENIARILFCSIEEAIPEYGLKLNDEKSKIIPFGYKHPTILSSDNEHAFYVLGHKYYWDLENDVSKLKITTPPNSIADKIVELNTVLSRILKNGTLAFALHNVRDRVKGFVDFHLPHESVKASLIKFIDEVRSSILDICCQEFETKQRNDRRANLEEILDDIGFPDHSYINQDFGARHVISVPLPSLPCLA